MTLFINCTKTIIFLILNKPVMAKYYSDVRMSPTDYGISHSLTS